MKNLVILCMLIVLATYQGKAQWPNHIDTSGNTNLVFSDIELFGATIGVHTDIVIASGDSIADAQVYINKTPYDALRLNSDNIASTSACYLVDFAENSDSTVVLSGFITDTTLTSFWNLRARVINTVDPDSTELAVTFHNTGLWRQDGIKDAYVTDSNLYILIDAVTANTTVEIVVNNGQPQAGTALTGTGTAFLKIDRFTGAIVKQVYFHHNDNDGNLNLTYWNISSLLGTQNRFYFTSVNSLGDNFMLHVYDRNIDSVTVIPIATDASVSALWFYDRHEMAYGTYHGEEYIGLIPKTIPVVVNLTTLDVRYIDAGSALNKTPNSTMAAFFVDSSFIFLQGVWIKRIELNTMTPSIIRHDWVTNSPNLDGKGVSPTQRNARIGSAGGFLNATLINGQIEYCSMIKMNSTITHGLFINGERITSDSLVDGDVMIYKGSLGLNIGGPTGTETTFSCSNCDSVHRIGNRVIYVVSDSASLANVQVIRSTGPKNAGISPGATDIIDFSSEPVVVFTLDFLGAGDISTIWVYLESAIVNTTPTNDTSGISLDENQEVLVSLYPNPFTDYINLYGSENRGYGISLYDLSGRIVFQRENIERKINVSHLIAGIYIAYVSDNHGNTVSVQKVIKR